MSRFADRLNRLAHAWNVFQNEDEPGRITRYDNSPSYSARSDRVRMSYSNDKSIVSSIYNRIAIDVSAIELQHVKLDENDSFVEEIDSYLNQCLKVEANIDQAATAFRIDIAMTLFEKGVIALVPIETTVKPLATGGYDIKTMRVAEITNWYPEHVEVDLYNQKTGRKQRIRVPKRSVAIIENPLYSVMNEPNSTLQRLIRKLNLLDAIDEQAGSGKLDIIIQLPYTTRTETRKQQAETRRQDMEDQLKGSKYGVAYADSTEKITQLNRPAENNMLKQVEYLTDMLYAQLGVTQEIFNGTATEQVMLNYYNRTVEPILTAISEAMIRSWLSKTARTQKQSIKFYRNPFKLMPVSALADIGDKMSRNEILSPNEIRAVIGYKPRSEASADELRNRNIPIEKTTRDMGELTAAPDNEDPNNET